MVNPVLDLRSNTKIGVANDPSPGIGLFNDGGNLVVGPWLWNAAGVDVAHWRAPVDVSGLGYTNLGSDPYATMSVANRTALAVTLGVNPGLLAINTDIALYHGDLIERDVELITIGIFNEQEISFHSSG